MADYEHGTIGRYRAGCRCDPCRENQNAYRQSHRTRTATAPDQGAPYPPVTGAEPCVTTDPELFFPEKGESPRKARGLCQGCEQLRPCLAYALTHTVTGVWGGTTDKQRQTIRADHGITVTPLHIGPFVHRQRNDHDTQESA